MFNRVRSLVTAVPVIHSLLLPVPALILSPYQSRFSAALGECTRTVVLSCLALMYSKVERGTFNLHGHTESFHFGVGQSMSALSIEYCICLNM